MRAARRHEGGFTLLEVLVAFAIAAPALSLLYRQGATSAAMSRTALSYQEAVSRAQSRLDALRDAALVAGEREGEDGGGYRWKTGVLPIATMPSPAAARSRRTGLYAQGTTLYAVTVQISWPGAGAPRAVTLDTRRLGPATGTTP